MKNDGRLTSSKCKKRRANWQKLVDMLSESGCNAFQFKLVPCLSFLKASVNVIKTASLMWTGASKPSLFTSFKNKWEKLSFAKLN